MEPMTHLPRRPLRGPDVAKLDSDDRLDVVPYGGVPDGDEVAVYAIKLAVGSAAYALGYDDARGRWQQLASVDAADIAVADAELDAVLDEWVQEQYGGRFEVTRNVV